MTTDLRGATHYPAPDAFPASPGEWAAWWNEMPLHERGELVARVEANARAAHECWAQAHVPGAVLEAEVAAARSAAAEGGWAGALALAVDALEAAGMREAARVVDGLATQARWERGADVAE